MSFYLAEIKELRKDLVESYKGGDLKRALFLGKQLLEIYKQNGGLGTQGFAEDTHNVGVIFDEIGLYDKAVECYLEAATIKKTRCGESVSFADTLNNLAIAYSKMGQHEAALQTHMRVLDLREKKLGRDHIDYIHTLYNIGNTHEALDQYDDALESLGQALEMSYCCKTLQMMDIADIHASMARCYEYKGNFKKAIFYFEFALDIIEKKQGVKSLHYITNATSLVSVCQKSEFIGLAVEYCEKVVEIRRQMFPQGHLDYVNNLNYLAALCRKDSQFDKALKFHKIALDLIEKHFGQKCFSYSDILDKIAIGFCYKKDFTKALEYSQRALELRSKTLPEGEVEITKSYMTLGEIADKMGDYAQATFYFQNALAVREKNMEDCRGAIADTWNKIAQLFDRQGAYEAAAFMYEVALKIRDSYFSAKNDTDVYFMKSLAQTRGKQGEFTRAVLTCLEMEKVARKLYGKEHPKYATALKHVGVAYQKSGDLFTAGRYLEQALNIQREALDEDNPIYIKTLEIFAEVCFNRGDCVRAIQLYKERNDVNFEETAQDRREAACTLLAIGNCYLKLGDKEKSKAYFTEAEEKIKRCHIIPNEKYNQLKAMFESGKNGSFQASQPGRKRMRDGEQRCLEQTIAFLIQFYEKAENTVENEKKKKAFVAFSLGEMHQRLGKKEEAIYWYTLAEKESEPEYYVRACTRLGEAYYAYGQEEKAFQKFLNVKEYIGEYGNPHSADYCKILGHIGDYFYKKGDKERALGFYDSWNQLYKELNLPDCLSYDNRVEKICKILTASDRYKEAVEEYCVLAMSIRDREGETARFAKLLLRMAILYIHLDNTREAETLLDRVLILAGKSGIASENFAKVCDKVGRLYSLAGLEEKAIEALKLAYNQSLQGKKCITKEGLQLLSRLLWKNGDNKAYFSIKNGCEME